VLLAATREPRNLLVLGAGAAAAGAVVFLLGVLPGVVAFALGSILFVALVARDVGDPDFGRRVFGPLAVPHRPVVAPEQLQAVELGTAYADVLQAHERLRVALRGGDRPADELCDVYGRCTELVVATGRVARSGDALSRYLGSRTALAVEVEAQRLDEKAERTRDPHAADAYRLAAGARRCQLDIYRHIGSLYDRIEARMILVTSFLSAVEAMVIKQQAHEVEQLRADIAEVSGRVHELDGEIAQLETRLDPEPAALNDVQPPA
jgi:hypothetical protein